MNEREVTMRMKQLAISLLCVAAVAVAYTAFAEKIDPVTHDVIPEPDDLLYNKAPDPLPWIPPVMIDETYWIGKMGNPDDVILTLDQIAKMNKDFRTFISQPDPFAALPQERKPFLVHWWPGHSLSNPELYRFDRSAVADTVRVRIGAEIEYLKKQDYGNCLAITYNAKEKEAFQNEMALDAVPRQIQVRHAITVRPARLRNIPSFPPQQPGLTQSKKTRWDLWNIGVIKIGRPVQVLHVSRSGEYLFVLSDAGYGWVSAADVAFASKEEIDDFINAPDFVVSTADRVLFFSDTSCKIASGWFGLGSRLPLKFKGTPHMVVVPVRKMNGSFATETVWIKADDNVSVGFLPYTKRNIVHTAFKLLGTPYDWSGGWFGRQHETIYIDLFSCFGFELPNHGTLFTYYNNNNTTVLKPAMGKDKYYQAINTNPPFVTLQSCGGHCQLYFGNNNGTPIVFDQHGYGYPDDNNVWWEVRRCNIGDVRLPRYFLTKEITFLELR